MNGTQTVKFSELFADTVRAHGLQWAHLHYTSKGMKEWEFRFWFGTMNGVNRAIEPGQYWDGIEQTWVTLH